MPWRTHYFAMIVMGNTFYRALGLGRWTRGGAGGRRASMPILTTNPNMPPCKRTHSSQIRTRRERILASTRTHYIKRTHYIERTQRGKQGGKSVWMPQECVDAYFDRESNGLK